MALAIFKQVRQAIEQLNPAEVREEAAREVDIRISAPDRESYTEIEDFLVPRTMSRHRRLDSLHSVFDASDADGPREADIDIVADGMPRPRGSFLFRADKPGRLVSDILDEHPELSLALARLFAPFHGPVSHGIIHKVSKENALFSIATALPDIAPGFAIPWAIPEAMSDTAVLSVNQVRMAFLLAAASGRPVGYREQKTEVASILAGALGWRALARQLVGKIPMGGGIIPKAGIAYAATYVEGRSLERLYRVGYGFTEEERKDAYRDALDQGKEVARAMYDRIKSSR